VQEGMNRLDPVEAQLEATLEEVKRLRSELRASGRDLARVLELLADQQTQLASQQTSITRLDRNFMDLTTGRVWRTLRAAGEIVKKFLPDGQRSTSLTVGEKNTYLVCDEPLPTDTRPRSARCQLSRRHSPRPATAGQAAMAATALQAQLEATVETAENWEGLFQIVVCKLPINIRKLIANRK